MPTVRDRLIDVAAAALVGDGVLGVLMPERRLRVWYRGPGWWERTLGSLLRHPAWTRALAAAEVGVGVWLASRERTAPEGRTVVGVIA
jgi:hypothetical protein